VLGAEQPLGPVDGQGLGDVDELTPAVVAATRIPFGVLVVHGGGEGGEHRWAGIVLRGDQAQRGPLPVELPHQRRGNLWIRPLERRPIRRKLVHGCSSSFAATLGRLASTLTPAVPP